MPLSTAVRHNLVVTSFIPQKIKQKYAFQISHRYLPIANYLCFKSQLIGGELMTFTLQTLPNLNFRSSKVLALFHLRIEPLNTSYHS